MPILPPESNNDIGKDYAEYHLTTSPESFLLNNDGITYTKIPNMVLNLGKGFSVTAGTLKKINRSGRFLINGTSDLEIDKAATITYALVVNGTPIPSELTVHTFTNQNKLENIAITALADISQNDEIEIMAKGDGTSNINITVAKLDVTFLEV